MDKYPIKGEEDMLLGRYAPETRRAVLKTHKNTLPLKNNVHNQKFDI